MFPSVEREDRQRIINRYERNIYTKPKPVEKLDREGVKRLKVLTGGKK